MVFQALQQQVDPDQTVIRAQRCQLPLLGIRQQVSLRLGAGGPIDPRGHKLQLVTGQHIVQAQAAQVSPVTGEHGGGGAGA